MAEKLAGKWKLHSSDNFTKYLKELGVSAALIKIANLSKPKVTFKFEDGGLYYKSSSPLKKWDLTAKIGEEFDEETTDGRKVKTIITWKGESLEQHQKWDGKETTISSSVDENGDLVTVCKMNDVISKQVYKKILKNE